MSELPDEVWWYTEESKDPETVSMEPEGLALPLWQHEDGTPQDFQPCSIALSSSQNHSMAWAATTLMERSTSPAIVKAS